MTPAPPLAAPLTPAEAGAPHSVRDTRRRPVVLVEFTEAQPCAHQAYYGATPVQAVRAVAERLHLRADQLGFRAGAFGQPDVFNREVLSPTTLASICQGLTLDETRAARAAVRAGAVR